MMMMSIIQQDSSTQFITPTVVAGSSSSIKVHGFLLSGSTIGLLLINKDSNSAASGTVFVESTNTDLLKCIYLSGSSLTSKNVTLAGMTFIGGNATPQGTYTEVSFSNPTKTGFNVTLNFA